MYPRIEIETETLSFDVETLSYKLTLVSGAEMINTITGKVERGGNGTPYITSASDIFKKTFLERNILFNNSNMLEITPGSFYNQEAIQKVEIILKSPHLVTVTKITAKAYYEQDVDIKEKYLIPE